MKLLLLPFLSIVTVSACAQISEADIQKLTQNSSIFKKQGQQLNLIPRQATKDSLYTLLKQMAASRNNLEKPAVQYLAPDRMPCLVPEMNEVANMPNAWKGKVVNVEPMPNPARRQSAAVSR